MTPFESILPCPEINIIVIIDTEMNGQFSEIEGSRNNAVIEFTVNNAIDHGKSTYRTSEFSTIPLAPFL